MLLTIKALYPSAAGYAHAILAPLITSARSADVGKERQKRNVPCTARTSLMSFRLNGLSGVLSNRQLNIAEQRLSFGRRVAFLSLCNGTRV